MSLTFFLPFKDFQAGPGETWRLDIPGEPEGALFQPLKHEMRLINYQLNCWLSNPGDVKLPNDWWVGVRCWTQETLSYQMNGW